MLYKEEVRMIMIIETVLVSVGLLLMNRYLKLAVLIAIVLTNGLIGFLVVISKMKGVGDIRLESKMLVFTMLSLLSGFATAYKCIF